MKILHIITGLNQGGAEGALVRLVCLSGNPNNHTVISLMDEGVHGAVLSASGAQVIPLGALRSVVSLSCFKRLISLIRQADPDVIQTWMYHADFLGGLAAKQLGIPVVWGVRHSDNSISDLGLKTWLVAKACALLSHLIPQSIVCCSKRAISLHLNFGYANRFIHIPNGLPVPTTDAITANLLVRSPPVFGHAARFHPMKNHAGFLSAVSSLKTQGISCQIKMVGTDVSFSNPDYSALVPSNIISVVSADGPCANMPGFYSGIDCFVMSSAWGEAFPNVVAEAMLVGLPCIVTDVGDAAEIVGDTGWVVPANNPEALANAMHQAIAAMANTDTWADRKAAACARITNLYSMDKMQSRFEAAWTAAMEN
jgi:glycosyltransferase involved in cell wall biosynthesis